MDTIPGSRITIREFAGLRLVDRVYPANTRVPSHSHQSAVFCVGLTGTCNEVFAGKVRQYQASTVEYLPANQCHALAFPSADMHAFSIDVATSWVERAREFSLRLDRSVHAHGGPLAGLMLKIYDEFRHLDNASPVSIQGLTMELLAAVSRQTSNPAARRPLRWLSRAEEFLRERFAERATIAEVAAAAGVHPVYLSREFRRRHGCTIGEYLRRLRVDRACRQLSASDESLSAIAAGSGFSDQSHFSRVFKRLMGLTPAQYRDGFH